MLKRLRNARELTTAEREFLGNLLEKNKPLLLHVIKIITGKLYNTLGEECLSELHCLTIRKIDKLIAKENPDRWLITAAKYIALELMRRYKNEPDTVLIWEVADQLVMDDVFEEARYNIWMEQHVLDKLPLKLTNRERQIYNLMIIQKMSCEDVARELNISESTVWNIRAAVVKKIEKIIKNDLF